MNHQEIKRFLRATLGDMDFEFTAVAGGANNRCFKVTSAEGERYFLKVFFTGNPS